MQVEPTNQTEQQDDTKSTKQPQKKLSYSFIQLVLITLLYTVIAIVVGSIIYSIVHMEKETNAWGDTLSSLTGEEETSCDVIKVTKVEKTFNPRGIELDIQNYVSDNGVLNNGAYKSTDTITLADTEVKVPQLKREDFIKACINKEGYIATIEVIDIYK